MVKALLIVKTRGLQGDAANAVFMQAVPDLIAANKCPDFIEDKGHEFGTTLPEPDKRALIALSKTF